MGDSISAVELTVSSKELTLLHHCSIPIEGESHAEFRVVAAIHKSKLWRRNGQARAYRQG